MWFFYYVGPSALYIIFCQDTWAFANREQSTLAVLASTQAGISARRWRLV
jgi:hypothetical protein